MAAGLALALLAGPAPADVTLAGSQHIGDGETAGSSFDPDDPVSRAQMQANPSHFHLSQASVVTAVRLEDADDLDGRLRVFIDDLSTALPGTLAGDTYTLDTPLTLGAGTHTIWPDGGCSLTGFALPCIAGGENDFGFSAITLVSNQITFSRAFTRRTHLGNSTEGDDDYLGNWYPDAPDGTSVSHAFTVEASRSLIEVRLYGLRDVSASSSGPRVLVDGTLVGAAGANGNPTIAASLALAAGPHTLTVEVGQHGNGSNDDVSWDDIVLVMVNNPATTPGQFNAVDPGADAAAGAITTKVAGTPFSLDLVAVTGGAQFAAYTGTLAVELVDASGAGDCAAWPAAAALGNVTFTAADGGRRSVAITYGDVLADARVRLTDGALQLSACSADNFAIRPHSFGDVTVTHGDASTAGTTEALASGGFSGSTQPVHRAGRPFTLRATAYTGAGAVAQGYAGEPEVTAALSLLGTHAGTASASGWTYPSAGAVRSDAVTYDEAGAVRLQLTDTTFAAVDADDTDAATRSTTPVSVDVGRFVPDHFTFTAEVDAEYAPGCAAGGFTYVGQPFQFVGAPRARVKAVAAGGTATRNYSDAGLYRVVLHAEGGALPQSAYAAADGTLDASLVPDPDNAFTNEGDGESLFTLLAPSGHRFVRGAPVAPFDAAISITLSLVDADGVDFASTSPGRFGDPAAGGIPFSGDASLVRFGRLVIDNAHGSERLPLAVPLRAEFWSNGFQPNGLDSCTTLTLGDLAVTTTLPTTPTLTAGAGAWTLTLSAPNTPGQATVEAALAARPWLQLDDADADAAYDDDPRGVATFGLASDRQRRIYQREVVGY